MFTSTKDFSNPRNLVVLIVLALFSLTLTTPALATDPEEIDPDPNTVTIAPVVVNSEQTASPSLESAADREILWNLSMFFKQLLEQIRLDGAGDRDSNSEDGKTSERAKR